MPERKGWSLRQICFSISSVERAGNHKSHHATARLRRKHDKVIMGNTSEHPTCPLPLPPASSSTPN